MAHPRWYLALIPLLATGCLPIFDQPTTGGDSDDERMYSELESGRPIAAVRAVSLGVTEVSAGQGPSMPVVHVRLTVANRHDARPWRIDAVNAVLGVPGRRESQVLFINTDITSTPIARVEKREVRIIDFYFPYPDGFDDPAQPPPLQFRASIATPQRTFIWTGRVGPSGLAEPPGAPAPGWAPYWWCDPSYPWPQFNRRPGRKTHRVPDDANLLRPPTWPVENGPGIVTYEPQRWER